MVEIDGSRGEGGGQVLRTALSLSLCLGKPFRIVNIRKNRPKPGLQPQHLMAVRAAARISDARTEGDEPKSEELWFSPGTIRTGYHEFDIGTAGSTTLVLQTLLPALMLAREPTELLIHGGTHNPMAPSFEFIKQAFLPLLNRMGAEVELELESHGFYPHGGGRLRARITPTKRLKAIELMERGKLLSRHATAMLSRLPQHIAERELGILKSSLQLKATEMEIELVEESPSAANVLSLALEFEQITELFTAFGKRGLPAEEVAAGLVAEVQGYLESDAPVGRHLADQLLLPMALAGGGRFHTLRPSRHTLTNIDIIRHFLDIDIETRQVGEDKYLIKFG